MNSKTSLFDRFFSKAIIKADLRNHWPWPVAMTVILFFNLLGFVNFGTTLDHMTWDDAFSSFSAAFGFSYFAACVYSFFVGTKLFMYLDKMNSVSCMHGLPFSRSKLYFSHILSGFVLAAVPPAVITAAMLILGAPYKNTVLMPSICFLFFAVYMVYSLMAFSISVFSMTVCGNVIVSMLLSCGIAVLPAAFIAFFEYICLKNIYGYAGGEIGLKILELLYLLPNMLLTPRVLIYIIASVLFIAAGCFVYKKRPLENCEEVVAFRKLRWLFVFTVGIVLGMISYMFFSGIFENDSPMCMLPLGLVGIICAAMFAKKSVSLRGTGRYILSYIALVLVISGTLEFDIFGYERRIPSAESIEYVEVASDYERNYYPYWISKSGLVDYRITDKDEINLVRNLHSAYIAEREESESRIRYNTNTLYRYNGITIEYKLKNGMTMTRRYDRLSEESFDKYLMPVLNTEKQKSKIYSLTDNTEKEIMSVNIYNNIDGKSGAYSYSDDETQRICDALKEDIKNNSVEDLYANGYIEVNVSYYVKGTVNSKGKQPSTKAEKDELSYRTYMEINENWTQTMALLDEMGYLYADDGFISKTNMVIIRKTDNEPGKEYGSVNTESSDVTSALPIEADDENAPKITQVTDKAAIEEIYRLCLTGFDGIVDREAIDYLCEYEISFIGNSQNAGQGDGEILYSAYFTLLPENLPESIRQYFED